MSERQRVATNEEDRPEAAVGQGEGKEALSLEEDLALITEIRASLGEDARDHVEKLVERLSKEMEDEVDEEHEEQMRQIEQSRQEARELLRYLQTFLDSADQTASDIRDLADSNGCFTHEEVAKLGHIAEKLEAFRDSTSMTTATAMEEKLKLHREVDLIIAAAKDRCSQSKIPAFLSIIGGAVAGAAGGAALATVVPVLGNAGGAVIGGIAGAFAGAAPHWGTIFPGRSNH